MRRYELRLSQDEFGALTGISGRVLQRIEAGQRKAEPEWRERASAAIRESLQRKGRQMLITEATEPPC